MSRIRQLAFDLPGRPAVGREDFFVAPSNALAMAKIDLWPRWTPPKLLVSGPKGAGKSHLAAVWASVSGAGILSATDLADTGLSSLPQNLVVEDADLVAGDRDAEVALFHAHNVVLDQGGALLVTGKGALPTWGITLPDLASRLAAADAVSVNAPDDTLLAAVLVKLFDDRQLIVTPDLISYLITRIDRSFIEAERVVTKLDRAAYSLRRRVTRSLAIEILNDPNS